MLQSISLNKIANGLSITKEEMEELSDIATPEVQEELSIESEINEISQQGDEYIELHNDISSTVETNTSILENENSTDEEIKEQFEIAQENLFLSLGRLGYKKEDLNKSILKFESNNTIRDNLFINTEGAKEVLIKIVEKIYYIIVAIIKKIAKWITIILNDLTGKTIPSLRVLAVKQQIEDEGLDYLRACAETYHEMASSLSLEDNSETSDRTTATVRKISRAMDNFVTSYGYLIDRNNVIASIQNVWDFYIKKSTANFDIAKVIPSLEKLSTSIDKKVINNLGIKDLSKPLIIYGFNEKTISACYVNQEGNFSKAPNFEHNFDMEDIKKDLMDNFFKENALITNRQLRTEIIKLTEDITSNAPKITNTLNKKLQTITRDIDSWKKETLKKDDKDNDIYTKYTKDAGDAYLAFIKAVYEFCLKSIRDITNILSCIKDVILL